MTTKTFEKLSKVFAALGLTTKSGALDLNAIERFINDIEPFKADTKELMKLWNDMPFFNTKVVTDKEGKVYIVRSVKINKPVDGDVSFEGLNVMTRDGQEVCLKFDDLAPYTETTKVLYNKD